LSSIASVIVAATAGVVLLLLPNHGDVVSVMAAVDSCLAAVQHGSPPNVEALGGLLGVGLVIALLIRLAVVGVRGYRHRARRRREHLNILRLAAETDAGSPATLWLAHDKPLAFSMAGRPGVVVATEGLNRHLPAESVAAVLAHERAHLRGRHHQLIAITDAIRATLPFVPLFRQAPAAMGELVELAADVVAARAHGAAALRCALVRVSDQDVPGLAMGRDAVDVRLARLRQENPIPGRHRRILTCGIAGAVATMAPFVAAGAALFAISLATCPVT
jgi:beta-lactamase regulating signal transducer with metallopeptidase domain